MAAHDAGRLQFFGNHAPLANAQAFAAYLQPLRKVEWVVYSKRPFGGPKEVLRYLSRYTHRVAISNRRLIACDDDGITFKWKDYRLDGPERYKAMTLAHPRVHPPLPDPRAALGLPPHPLLRPARQRQPCRQHRASPRTARGANTPDRGHQGRQHRGHRTANTRASLPLLRRPHDHHRDLRSAAARRDIDRPLPASAIRIDTS